MELMTQELSEQLPPLYTTEHDNDPMVICKFFTPWADWTWYVIEGEAAEYEDGGDFHWHSDYLFFGWVRSLDSELGYFRLSELQSIRGPYGLTIERDLSFEPTRLSIIKKQLGRR
jgi:Protein of unknown function (DUF2958)